MSGPALLGVIPTLRAASLQQQGWKSASYLCSCVRGRLDCCTSQRASGSPHHSGICCGKGRHGTSGSAPDVHGFAQLCFSIHLFPLPRLTQQLRRHKHRLRRVWEDGEMLLRAGNLFLLWFCVCFTAAAWINVQHLGPKSLRPAAS